MTRSLLIVMFAAGFCAAQTPAPVKVEGGLVQGAVENGLAVYRGIPFAAPPVGDLRWKAPQPVVKWKDVKETTKFAAPCMQGGGGGRGPTPSEDCLYLNLWSPAKSPSDRIPVFVWIYGGGFSGGSTAQFNGEKLAQKGVVLVTIAYRVGPMGFFAHPELSAETKNHVSGNYGLLDMIGALQWVQKNIAAFGGDPKRVSIFGESAGGMAVSMLCGSPLAKGLFRGAISQSGGSLGPPRPDWTFPGENMKRLADAERAGVATLKAAGAASIAEARKLPPSKINPSALLPGAGAGGRGQDVPGRSAHGPDATSWPVIDGYFMPDDEYKIYESKRNNDVAALIGYNSDEGLSLSMGRTPEEYIANVKLRFGPFADRLVAAYPPGTGSGPLPKTARDLMRDATFGWHTWAWARMQSKNGKGKVFFYHFDQHPDYPPDSPQAGRGSPHGQDVAYVFQSLSSGNPQRQQYTKSDEEISEAMATYWTNFAKNLDPNGPGLPNWPAFNDANPVLMYFAQTAHTGPVPGIESMKVMDAYFTWRRTPEGDAFAKQ